MSKRLQMDYVYVKTVEFGETTRLEGSRLILNKEDLLGRIDTSNFESADILLASPGDDVRILGVEDCTQPRVKAENPNATFPGFLGELAPAGEGRTVALKGVLVTELYPIKANFKSLVDMKGPIADVSMLARHHHIILDFRPKENVTPALYCQSQKTAALRLAVYLANLAIDREPDESKVYELKPVSQGPDGRPLPKVAYLTSQWGGFDVQQFFYYGQSGIGTLPFVVHPNEILDGAFLYRYFMPTYFYQEEAMIKELYDRHGKDIEFVGMVMTCGKTETGAKEASSMIAASIARDVLHADITINTTAGMGHCQLEQQLLLTWSERLGMRAVAVMRAVSSEKPGDLLVISDPAVDAVIHCGKVETMDYPRMEKLIGVPDIPALMAYDLHGPFTITTNGTVAGISSTQGANYMTEDLDLPTEGWNPPVDDQLQREREQGQPAEDRGNTKDGVAGTVPGDSSKNKKKKLRVVHYLNQFYAQFGGEDTAGMGIKVLENAAGPGLAVDRCLGKDGNIVATIVCGDNYAAENLEEVTAKIVDIVKSYEPDLFLAGPGFNAGRYSLACGSLAAAVRKQLHIPAVTGLYEEAPGAELYSGLCYIIATENNARKMADSVRKMTEFGLKLVRGEDIGTAAEEGYLGTGPVRPIHYEIPAPKRAVDMALDKFYGRKFMTEVPMPIKDEVPPSRLDKPLREAKIALVTDGGLVPLGNPDRMVPVNSVKFAAYPLTDKERLDASDYEVRHQGYDNTYVLEDPNRLVPLDALRKLEHEGKIGTLEEKFFTTAGVMTTLENGKKFGKEIAEILRNDGVDAVILTST